MAENIPDVAGSELLGNSKEHKPACLEISERGIKTGGDYANFMSALMGDVISGRVTPQVGNAACNAGSKLLKVVEMQYRYGSASDPSNRKLKLAE